MARETLTVPAPMDVRAVYKGKRKAKGEKGKGKGKGKGKNKEKDKDKEKDPATNPDAEMICYDCHKKGHRKRDCRTSEEDKDKKGVNAVEQAPGLTPGGAAALSVTPSRVRMIELDDWILSVSLADHEEMVGSMERVMVDGGAAVSVCPLECAPEVPMSNHSRRATLRTASGAQTDHAGQKMVEHENGDGGLVNVNFEVADVTRPLVAVGELQKRGMTVEMGPHGSFVTRGKVMKLPDSNLDLGQSNGAYWMSLTRGENGTSTVAVVLGDAVPTSKDLSELPSV